MLQSGLDLGAIVAHQLPADRFEDAFEIVVSGECGKVILDWAGGDAYEAALLDGPRVLPFRDPSDSEPGGDGFVV
jgi:hypothetical protein